MMNHKIALVDFLNEDPFFEAVSFILLLLLLLFIYLGGDFNPKYLEVIRIAIIYLFNY